MKKQVVLLFMISLVLALFGCQEKTDDGKRETIKVSTIEWSIFEDSDEMNSIMDIKINGRLLENGDDYPKVVKLLNENQSAISETKKDNYIPVYISFEKFGFLSERGPRGTYDGKDTNFYVKKDILKDYIK